MKMFRLLKNQAGFTLVQAIFILVVLALLGVVMMRMVGTQSTTSAFALQGARAYQIARSGLEWGAAQVVSGACAASSNMMIDNFSVTVDCSSTPLITEGNGTVYRVFYLESLAEFGNYGSPSYIQRRMDAKIRFP